MKTLTSDEEEPKLSPMHYAALTLIQETECGQDLQPREREKFAKRWSVAEETALLFEPSLTRKAEKDKKRRHIGKHLASQKQDDAPIQANTNTGGFGSTQAPTPLGTPSTFGASTTSGFGTPSTFGASTPSTFGTSTTSGFGSTTTKSSLEPKPFFGSSTTNSSMGGPAPIQANTNTGGFGTSHASTPVGTSSTFGASTTSGFGTSLTFGTSTTSGFGSTTTGSKPFFGSSTTNSSMAGPAPTQANTNTGGFGTSQASTPVGTSSTFGTSTTSGFGTPSTFGTSTTSGFGSTTTFGASTTSGLGIPSTFVRPRYVTSKLESIDEVIPLLNCSINEKTSDGATPLLLLCMSVSHSSEAKVKNATSLIKHGANVNLAVRRDNVYLLQC